MLETKGYSANEALPLARAVSQRTRAANSNAAAARSHAAPARDATLRAGEDYDSTDALLRWISRVLASESG